MKWKKWTVVSPLKRTLLHLTSTRYQRMLTHAGMRDGLILENRGGNEKNWKGEDQFSFWVMKTTTKASLYDQVIGLKAPPKTEFNSLVKQTKLCLTWGTSNYQAPFPIRLVVQKIFCPHERYFGNLLIGWLHLHFSPILFSSFFLFPATNQRTLLPFLPPISHSRLSLSLL